MHDQLTRQDIAAPALVSSGRDWTGGDATALRKALRMTEGKFARAAGVSPRTVSNWSRCPEMVPRSAAQDMLDELLAGASPAVRARFVQRAWRCPASPAAGSARDEAEVVSLGIHPRYTADFRALASAQVAAARTALGLSMDEFTAWLERAVGWSPVTGADVVQSWEDGRGTPPGDVVMAAQAALAGTR